MDNKTNKMLIDATHPEETRVVVLRNGRVEEFDYESAARKLLRGNIYLAKVTRVEPSLQAAFVEYGGNRHGFLAFNEIHPDYYQIPMSDRQALIDDEAAAEAEADAEADARAERRAQSSSRREGGRDGDRDGQRDGQREGRGGRRSGHRSGRHDGNGGRGHSERNPLAEAGSEQPRIDDGGALLPEASAQATIAAAAGHPVETISEPYAPEPGAAHDDRHDHHDHDGHQHEHSHDTEAHAAHPEAAHDHLHDAPHDHLPPDTASHHDEAAGRHDTTRDDHRTGDERHHDGSNGNGNGDGNDQGGHGDGGRHAIAGAEHIEQVPDVIEAPETIGEGVDEDVGHEEDGAEEVQERPRRQRRRQYKIQEVIKRRQVILVQVVKEERGNKGAALTTYLSLAGRYTVLMPNTGRGGGISRKITQPGDRKRLKAVAQELDVQEGMGLIIRTAGAARTSQEIKRDYEYLLRLWESVRDLTLQSTAPSLVYEEGNLIKRSIRDLYTKEIDEVVVAGDQAYEDANAFMRMLMPSHVKNVTRYSHGEALFSRYPIERQLTAMFSPYVTLKSGGYLVINQTEALVSIDINSGKSTREYSIEETALATNLEASDEIARQLKLRDLAGLIVIDFIDMEEKRNNRKVEHRLTDALRFDRARIQVGRISHFGLLEMSRQRMRTGVLEGSTTQCAHCQGTGMIRSTESVALAVLRGLEDHLAKDGRSSVNVLTTATVALYILNNKRTFIVDIERRYGAAVAVQASDRMQGANFAIERSAVPVIAPRPADRTAVSMDWGLEGNEPPIEGEEAPEMAQRYPDTAGHDEEGEPREGQRDTQDGENGEAGGSPDGQRGRRRRRRRGRDRNDRGERSQQGGSQDVGTPNQSADAGQYAGPNQASENLQQDAYADSDGEPGAAHDDADTVAQTDSRSAPEAGQEAGDQPRRSRRRGRRGGRRGREHGDGNESAAPLNGNDANGHGTEGYAEDGEGGKVLDAEVSDEGVDETGHGASEHHSSAPLGAAHAADPSTSIHVADEGHGHPAEPRSVVHDVTHAEPSSPVEPPKPHRAMEPQKAAPPARVVEAPVAHEPTVPPHAPRAPVVPVTELAEAPDDPARPRRRGWWQRRGLGE